MTGGRRATMQTEESRLREKYLNNFIIHFKEAERRMKRGETKLRGNGSAAEVLMSALIRYVSLSSSYDPFSSLEEGKEEAYRTLKGLLTPELLNEYKREGGILAEKIVEAEDEEFKADFEAMTTYVFAATEKGKRAEDTLREFYSACLLSEETEKANAFCLKERKFEEGKATGFPVLDNVLEGGLYSGLYVIGAPSSAGKTSFCIQLSDQLAQQGYKTLFFSLEMSEEELMSKSLSRLTYLLDKSVSKRNAKSERRLTSSRYRKNFSEEEWALLGEAAGFYASRIAGNKRVIESVGEYGVNEIARDVKAFISATGEKPVIFVDYLQILKPNGESMTDKQNTDRNVTALKRLCRDEEITAFVISSFNRASYHQMAGLEAFKESGAIEYSADVVFTLQPEGLRYAGEADKKAQTENKEQFDRVKRMNVRPMILNVLKNRRGRTGEEIAYDYNCVFGLFTETGEKREEKSRIL